MIAKLHLFFVKIVNFEQQIYVFLVEYARKTIYSATRNRAGYRQQGVKKDCKFDWLRTIAYCLVDINFD